MGKHLATQWCISICSAFPCKRNGGRGVGRALIEAAEQRAQQEGAASIEMVVVTSRTNLVAWYEKQGYSRVGDDFPAPWTHVMLDEYAGKVMACNMRKTFS